jgi:hypothetical protein
VDDRKKAADTLDHWLKDPDFAGTRGGLPRIGMSATERAEWDSFWIDVRSARDELRAK